MFRVIAQWFQRHFSHPQAVLLAVLLVVGFTIVLTMGTMLAPVIAAVVIAYLLEGPVNKIERSGMKRLWVVIIVFLLFSVFVAFLTFGVTPLLWAQAKQLIRELPGYFTEGQRLLANLPEQFAFISHEQVRQFTAVIQSELAGLGQRILTLSLASIPGVITWVVYLILVPLLVFFFLKDKELIVRWLTEFMPRERGVATQIWRDVDQQLGNYVRGKFWEILIVGGVTYVTFAAMGLKYSALLATLVGFSVIIPYIGAAVVTIPVAVIAFFQWGWGADFAYLMIAYGVIQALDGNLLVPLLFSEVVNIHPIAIIVSVLVFGGLWGFWGVFFAIPLATLFNVLLRAWPRAQGDERSEEASPSDPSESAQSVSEA